MGKYKPSAGIYVRQILYKYDISLAIYIEDWFFVAILVKEI